MIRPSTEQRNAALLDLIDNRNQERKRVSDALHDDLGAMLSTARAHLTGLRSDLSSDNQLHIDRAEDLIDQVCHDLRRLAYGLFPPQLRLLSLKAAIFSLAESNQVTVVDLSLPAEQELIITDRCMLFELMESALRLDNRRARMEKMSIEHQRQRRLLQCRFIYRIRAKTTTLEVESLRGLLAYFGASYRRRKVDSSHLQLILSIPL